MSKRATLNSAFKAGKIHKQNRNAHSSKSSGLSKFPFEKLTTTQSGDKRRGRITKAVCLFRGFIYVLKIIVLISLTDANEGMFTFLIPCLNKDKTCSRKTARPAMQTHPLSLSPKT